MSYRNPYQLGEKGGFTLPVELTDRRANRAKEYATVSASALIAEYNGSQQAMLDAMQSEQLRTWPTVPTIELGITCGRTTTRSL